MKCDQMPDQQRCSLAEQPGRNIIDRLLEYYSEGEALRWLRSPHQQLNGETPIDVIALGRRNEVEAILDLLDGDVFI